MQNFAPQDYKIIIIMYFSTKKKKKYLFFPIGSHENHDLTWVLGSQEAFYFTTCIDNILNIATAYNSINGE